MNNCQDPVLHILDQVNRKLRIEILVQKATQKKKDERSNKQKDLVGKCKQNLRFLT